MPTTKAPRQQPQGTRRSLGQRVVHLGAFLTQSSAHGDPAHPQASPGKSSAWPTVGSQQMFDK